MRQFFNGGNDGGSGCRKAGNGFEKGIFEVRDFLTEPQRKAAEERQQNPAESGDDAAFLQIEYRVLRFAELKEKADKKAEYCGTEIIPADGLAVEEGRQNGNEARKLK